MSPPTRTGAAGGGAAPSAATLGAAGKFVGIPPTTDCRRGGGSGLISRGASIGAAAGFTLISTGGGGGGGAADGGGGGGGGGGGDVNITQIAGYAIEGDVLPTMNPRITYYDFTFEMTGASDTVFATGQSYYTAVFQNPIGNDPITVNLAGGDATLTGIVIAPGEFIRFDNGFNNDVTAAGTATQKLVIFVG
jgi:hypothetical protein